MIASFQPRRKLRIGTTAPQIHHQVSRNRSSTYIVRKLLDNMQHQINSRRYPRARITLAILNVEPILQHLRIWRQFRNSSQQA